MLNVLPFVAGLIAGAATVSVLRSERTHAALQATSAHLRTAYEEAQSGVRTAARSGLDRMRGLASPPAPAVEAEPAAAAEPEKPARRSARRKAAAQPASTGTDSTQPATAKPRAARAPRKPKPEQAEA